MSTAIRREKMFGDGRLRPLDRNAKHRIMVLARALSHRTEKGKAYGEITAKFLAVLEALLWGFHNATTAAASRATSASQNAPAAPARPFTRLSAPSSASAS
jgi:hypothetical protein